MDKLLVSKECGDNIKVKVSDVVFGGEKKVVIAGPCSVESFDTMLLIAQKVKEAGADMLRGGAFKPRTSPYSFQGFLYEGLKVLKEVSIETGLPIISEVMDMEELNGALPYIDMIQIGSRNMYNYSLLKEVGKLNVPVLLKRGMSATLSEWMNAAEYIMLEGNQNIVLCERGIRTFEDYTRNTLDLSIVAAIKKNYRLPVIADPSHGTGIRELVPSMSLASLAAGADGLLIETHICPDKALSDANQTISIESLKKIIERTKVFESVFK